MIEPELLGRLELSERDLYLARLERLADWPAELTEPKPHFVVFLAMDATATSSDDIAEFGRRLLAQGMAYVCAWGPDCERVHNLFDLVDIEGGFDDDSYLMSTGHADEALDEALWFALFATGPADSFADTCRALVAIVVGHGDWASDVAAALSDVDRFNREVLARQPDE